MRDSESREVGPSNSSITRVRPFFQYVFRSAPSHWLSSLISCATENRDYAEQLAKAPGILDPQQFVRRRYVDRVLKSRGIPWIELETCFERRTAPPNRFLRWLIENPNPRHYPNGEEADWDPHTRQQRQKLFGQFGPKEAEKARASALLELQRFGRDQSNRKWWAFEGFSEVDCLLETESMLLLIEGKRTEPLSRSTSWYPERNQLVRNLEVAEEEALKSNPPKEFAVLTMSEEPLGAISEDTVAKSLPHFTPPDRAGLMRHYLGCVTWQSACEQLGLDFRRLPHTTSEVAFMLKEERVGLKLAGPDACVHFRDEFRGARDAALRDAEAFDQVLFVLERFGSYLSDDVAALAAYAGYIKHVAKRSGLALDVPKSFPHLHIRFDHLYELVRDARNAAMHQGAFARHLTTHALELTIVLEDALMSGLNEVGQFMVKSPVCACDWQPLSFVRQAMLLNSFSYLPIYWEEQGHRPWRLVPDHEIAKYLRSAPDNAERSRRLTQTLGDAVRQKHIVLSDPDVIATRTPVQQILTDYKGIPILVTEEIAGREQLIGIVTAFDVL